MAAVQWLERPFALPSHPTMAAPSIKQTFLDFEQPIAELQAKID
jgi:hypothetical protein